jgi:23S rRNA (uracil1939-C5)-methyltransferase
VPHAIEVELTGPLNPATEGSANRASLSQRPTGSAASEAPPCPHAPACVPCPFRGLPYRAQLARKRERVVEAFARHAALSEVPIDDVVGSRDLFGYRNVAKLAVRTGRGGRLRAGVYAPGTHRLVDAERCAVQHSALNDVLVAALDEAAALGIEAYDERTGSGELRYLVARYGGSTRKVLLVVVTGDRDSRRLRELSRRVARRSRSLGGVVHNVNDERGNVILGRRFATLRPPAEIVERIGGFELEAGPGSFLQANPWTARRIYETALDWSAPERADLVVDLFCGVGPLSLYLATRAGRVVGVEEAPNAVRDARANQRRNRLYNIRFVEGRVDDVLPRLRDSIGRAAVVSLNPTRHGASPKVLATIAALEPRRVVYVACDPDTLARDLDRLAAVGYRARRVRPFDMLPQTEHVEIVAEITRARAFGMDHSR